MPLSEQIFHFSTTQEDLASHWLLSAGLASGNDAKYYGASGVEPARNQPHNTWTKNRLQIDLLLLAYRYNDV